MSRNVINFWDANYILENKDIIDLKTLLDDLYYLSEWYEVLECNITEKTERYKVKNIMGEVEGEFVYFWDSEDILREKKSVLNMFLIKSISKIIRTWIPFSKKYMTQIIFKEGCGVKFSINIP